MDLTTLPDDSDVTNIILKGQISNSGLNQKCYAICTLFQTYQTYIHSVHSSLINFKCNFVSIVFSLQVIWLTYISYILITDICLGPFLNLITRIISCEEQKLRTLTFSNMLLLRIQFVARAGRPLLVGYQLHIGSCCPYSLLICNKRACHTGRQETHLMSTSQFN